MRSLWLCFLLLLAMLGSSLTVPRGMASTKSIDAVRSQAAVREHQAADNAPIDWSVGAVIPNFAFTDFNGKAHQLSEFRGKYLLLDFWGIWCKPCVAEIPYLKAAYTKYQSRGFEMLSLDYEYVDKGADPATATKDTFEKVKKFVAEREMIWTHATFESVKDLIEQRFKSKASHGRSSSIRKARSSAAAWFTLSRRRSCNSGRRVDEDLGAGLARQIK